MFSGRIKEHWGYPELRSPTVAPEPRRECRYSLGGSAGFLQGDWPFLVVFYSDGCARAHPSGVAPEASEEWFDSSEVLILFVMPQSALLFPHAAWL
jgi:hypothetical protein